jgi:dTDP-4-amino-4,6-dideoxygalactose transaminase
MQEAMEAAALRVLRHKQFILGEEVLAFEQALAERLGVAHVVATSSGSDALLLALQACGVGPGSSVLTSPFSFFASVGAVLRLSAQVRFVDIEPKHYGLDLALARRSIQPCEVLLPTHLFGHCQDLSPFVRECPNAVIVEDACQAIDAHSASGAKAGTLGRVGVLSFFPTKNLGAAGDAGALLTRDAELAARLRRLRAHGQQARYEHREVGGNFRMDAMQAAILGAALPFLAEATHRRRAAAERYRELLADRALEAVVQWPELRVGDTAHQVVVRIPERRDAVRSALEQGGISTAIYYPRPLHLQEPCRHLGYQPGAFPETERACREVLALPIAGVTDVEQVAVVDALAAALRGPSR